MKAETIIQEVEALLYANIKLAERMGSNTLSLISLPRAKMIMHDIKAFKSARAKVNSKHLKREPAWLDRPE
jgi:hypothetical protein